jgi:hypothetical protein
VLFATTGSTVRMSSVKNRWKSWQIRGLRDRSGQVDRFLLVWLFIGDALCDKGEIKIECFSFLLMPWFFRDEFFMDEVVAGRFAPCCGGILSAFAGTADGASLLDGICGGGAGDEAGSAAES